MKKMISFLGTNEYLDCYYEINDFTSSQTRFIQTALYEMLKQEGTQIDKVYIFLTKEAKENNFLDCVSNVTKKPLIGLENVWNEKFKHDDIELIPIMMNSNQLEKNQWELFEQIYDKIEENDEIYFDITHSFRSNPIIALIIANFAKTLKNATLKRLFYGNFEALGPAYKVRNISVEKRIAPIVDITSMLELLDWTIAVDTFLRTGNPVQIVELADDKSRLFNRDPGFQAIRYFAGALNNFNISLETVRGPDLNNKINNVLDKYPKLEKHKTGIFPQFEKLTNKIEDKLTNFSNDEVKNKLGTVIWANEHGLYQQSITLLSEHIISIIAENYGVNVKDIDSRLKISGLLQELIKEKNNSNSDSNKNHIKNIKINEEELKLYLEDLIETYPELKTYEKLATLRNDINHAGYREAYKNPDTIKKNIDKYIDDLTPFFKKLIKD